MVDFDMEPIYRTIGQQIRFARESLAWSQADLALKLDVSAPAITHYENATRRIPLHHLDRLEDILDRPHEFFLGKRINVSRSARDQIVSIAEQLDKAKYLPLIEFPVFDNDYDPYDLRSKPMLPFPQAIAGNSEFVYKVNKGDKTQYIFIYSQPDKYLDSDNDIEIDPNTKIAFFEEIEYEDDKYVQIPVVTTLPRMGDSDKFIGFVWTTMEIPN